MDLERRPGPRPAALPASDRFDRRSAPPRAAGSADAAFQVFRAPARRPSTDRGGRHRRPAVLVLVILALLAGRPGLATAEDSLEAKVKTAYIYHLLQFAREPAPASPEAPQRPLHLAILGDDPIAPLLEQLAREPMTGRALHISRLPENADLDPSIHVVFLGRSLDKRLPQVLSRLHELPVLTISDIPLFPQRGGSIGFVKDRGKVRLQINLDQVKRQGWHIHAKVLEVARVVTAEGSP